MSCEDELEPPWARYPEIIHGSIGWRMGGGESYSMQWYEFARRELTTGERAYAYFARHPPAPRSWTSMLARFFRDIGRDDDELEDDEDDSPDAGVREELEDRGAIGDDVAYPVFVRNVMRDGGFGAPWRWPMADQPARLLRYRMRELGWWARWFATECVDRAAWLAAQPEPSEAWAAIATALRRGGTTAWTTVDGGPDVLIPAMAELGVLPPPWLGGHAPIHDTEGDDDRHHWARWVLYTFEDAASWRAYLERWPPPEAWSATLARIAGDFYG